MRTQFRKFFSDGRDIRILGVLFVISGTIDLFWIMSYPDYALKVYGTTFDGWRGAFVKYQHPIIHWAIGYGFWYRQRWAYWAYLAYLMLACLSEITTQMVEGYHPTRITMIIVSLLFGAYIISRRNGFESSNTVTANIYSSS
ncbi:MAG: hypothetical protein NPIRA02_42630 [Nitrospirales bacterium]|nr:MAG: hypothetical protein NPIRA02_42630 [Nitrospirales bacterium]